MTAVAESISNGTSLDASYKYDALGRRIEKTINDTTTRYLYDGADIVLEMNENDAATIYYIRTLNIDEPLARIELDSGGNVTGIRFYLADALDSIIALTDENGDIKTRYNYTPFGEPEVIGEESSNPFQFAGRENDEGTGLLFERNRYYSWELDRYISEDPIGFAGGNINFYVRVGNNPVNYTDPLGLFNMDSFGAGISLLNLPGGALPAALFIHGAVLDLDRMDSIVGAGEGVTKAEKCGYYNCLRKCYAEVLVWYIAEAGFKKILSTAGFKIAAKRVAVIGLIAVDIKINYCTYKCSKKL